MEGMTAALTGFSWVTGRVVASGTYAAFSRTHTAATLVDLSHAYFPTGGTVKVYGSGVYHV
jgi:hypothetical protein